MALTRNPPSGLVTSVVPMVMFSLTSFSLGIVVFAETGGGGEKIGMNKQSAEQGGEEQQLDKFLGCIFP